ncbi:phage tail protein [Escherichia coli]|uniref:phage tail protein n=1 Tax=Escherichia coli TaxID=562 RepID=UPI0003A60515
MDNGAHFDGDQSGTVNGVTPPACSTDAKSPQTAGISGAGRWDTPKVVKGVSFCFA